MVKENQSVIEVRAPAKGLERGGETRRTFPVHRGDHPFALLSGGRHAEAVERVLELLCADSPVVVRVELVECFLHRLVVRL